ncbi:hypothetical protein G6F57_007397 [Rhizopus arrhizus]|uniref:EF-hand domain-containing protein n=1 Tax=Rhizopus oryzae TaxID=64495 RepID=A0A9P6X832_RHIOR|nr:hypothetical protein G6F23_009616 [Rhizopus arrhizus]KAG1421899.1 hypothetical protein G6F58_003544 [Rhizopus delemar]KAG0762136.1 hypothetical protein G6F24_007022 [Rhizopus arrhizus]KAG0781507.1 hypothetical protein G6F22_009535 [Rhizopus arrhizus]KAG0788560.1 hypothetical protein G6F21_007127 [Rhizopus arrhizus]
MKKHSNRQIKKVFESHDIDDTGYLDNNSLYEALVELKLPVQLEDMPDLFESVGRQKEKTIDLEDFMDIVTELQEENMDEEEDYFIPEEQEIKSNIAYHMLEDPNVNGITLKSLLTVCAAQEPSWTEKQIMEMLNEADLNHDGIIDSHEFNTICKRVGLA